MRKKQTLLPLALMLAMLICCAFGACAEDEDISIGITVYDLRNQYFDTLLKGACARADEMGVQLIVNDPASDTEAQVRALYNFIAMDVDAIIVCSLDVEATEEPLKLAREKGIRIISQSSKTDTRDIWVSAAEWEMGYVCGKGCGKWLAEKYGKEAAPYVVVMGWDVIPSQIARGDAMEAAILEYMPNANIIRRNANTTYQGISQILDVLRKYPDVTAVTCLNDTTALGIYSVIKDKGYDTDDFYIGGIDAVKEALELIKTECAYRATVDIIPYENGKLDVSLAVQLVRGENVPETYDIPAKLVTYESLNK